MIRHPSSVIVAGPSGSGKSDLTERLLLEQSVFQQKPRKIVYCYDRWQPRFDRMKKHMLFYKGIPEANLLTRWFGPTRGGVMVLDDLMAEGGQDKQVLDLFTQDLFPPGKFSKTINRNAHYLIAFKNPRDQTGIRIMLTQAFPSDWRDKLDLFSRVTSRPFGYLMLDLHPASDDRFRFWSHLTRQEGTPHVHV